MQETKKLANNNNNVNNYGDSKNNLNSILDNLQSQTGLVVGNKIDLHAMINSSLLEHSIKEEDAPKLAVDQEEDY